MGYLEIIKDISVFSVAVATFICLIILYAKIFFATKEIKKINEKIEDEQEKKDEKDRDIKGMYEIRLDLDGSRASKEIEIEQSIRKLKRKKQYLLEEISLYKIFKK